ncbi:putative uridine kinase [Lederbergia lenta]|uniref:Putative uridine kinase n=1 Tax=Lederbergia lenta TaxID=1467 RepID=A0A2X4ZE09_LEDLE|nr:putative uridine kinase [Lederbergia lenta]
MNLKAINGQSIYLNQLELTLNSIPKKQLTRLIGIDGCGGSGKTTFAEKVKAEFTNQPLFIWMTFIFPSLK